MNWYKIAEDKTENIEQKIEYISCPFCGEKDFDKIGLKHHLESGQCDIYNSVDIFQNPYEN